MGTSTEFMKRYNEILEETNAKITVLEMKYTKILDQHNVSINKL